MWAAIASLSIRAQEIPANKYSEAHGPWGMYYRAGVTQRLHRMHADFGVSFDAEIGAVYYFTPNWFATLGVGYTGQLNSNDSYSFAMAVPGTGAVVKQSGDETLGSVKIPVRIGYDFGPVALTAGLYLDWVVEDDYKITQTVQGVPADPSWTNLSYSGHLSDEHDFNTVIPGICIGATFFKTVTLEFGLGIINRDYHTNESYWHTSLGAKVFF